MIGVIFDMDGTLFDTQKICILAWEYAGNLQGIKGVGESIVNVCGMNETGWTNYLKETYKNLETDSFKIAARDYIIKNGKVEFKKGAKELIAFLKENSIKIAIASGSSKTTVLKNLSKVGLNDVFDSVVGGDEVERGKPHPDIFLLASEKIGVNPEDCFVFEDSKHGIISGSCAGMKCIGIPDIVEFDEETKKLMYAKLSSLDEGIEIIRNYLDKN